MRSLSDIFPVSTTKHCTYNYPVVDDRTGEQPTSIIGGLAHNGWD